MQMISCMLKSEIHYASKFRYNILSIGCLLLPRPGIENKMDDATNQLEQYCKRKQIAFSNINCNIQQMRLKILHNLCAPMSTKTTRKLIIMSIVYYTVPRPKCGV